MGIGRGYSMEFSKHMSANIIVLKILKQIFLLIWVRIALFYVCLSSYLTFEYRGGVFLSRKY